MGYNVQPLRSQQEINDFLFCLRRNKNAERDVFLFLIGINSGLRMSDIVKLKKKSGIAEIKFNISFTIYERILF